MIRAVGCALGRLMPLGRLMAETNRRSVGAFDSWHAHLTLLMLLRFVAVDLPTCKAVELPSIAEITRASSALRVATSDVEGEIRVFRSETVNPAAIEKLPSEIGLPLVLSGNLWRSKDRFRADFRSFHRAPGASGDQHSVAVDGGKVYELTSGADPDGGILQVCDADTPEAAAATRSITKRFYGPLDALWASGSIAFVDMIQRPDAKIVPSQRFPGGYSAVVSADDGTKARFEFEAVKDYPLGYYVTSQGQDKLRVRFERRAFSVEKEGKVFPTRIVDVVSLGSGGFTKVVMLDLRPLSANSPIKKPLTPASFQNLGSGYQVYVQRKSGKEQLAERYESPGGSSGVSGVGFRAWFLWVNGCVVVGLLAFLTYRYMHKRKAR